MSLLRKEILKLTSYSVPQETQMIKLNQNESPFNIPSDTMKKIISKLQKQDLNRYPSGDAGNLKEKISGYTDFPASGIIVGNGSNELIRAVISSTCAAGDKITTVKPSFSIYRRLAAVLNARIEEVPLREDFSFDVERIINRAKDSRLTILASPNNPTGTALTMEEIREIAENLSGVVAIDEAYYEFHKTTAQSLIQEHENLIVLRTFSKALGLAGIRLGYLLSNKTLVENIEKAKLPFSVGVFQQVVGETVLENPSLLEENREMIIREREKLLSVMKDIPTIDPIKSTANFVSFSVKHGKAKEVFDKLYQKGILLRSFSDPDMANLLRVTIGTPAENNAFIKASNEVIRENKK